MDKKRGNLPIFSIIIHDTLKSLSTDTTHRSPTTTHFIRIPSITVTPPERKGGVVV